MKDSLIKCDKCGIIFGCIKGNEEWNCALCERQRSRFFKVCPWNSWGGKPKKELNGEPVIIRTCPNCIQASRTNEPPKSKIFCELPLPPKIKVFVRPA